jgi:glycosyltransferase involved in cell wall biosynthesis
MLIPRKDNYFNRCKSNIKFLEASMLEIPVVATSFKNGPYEELTTDIGLKAKNDDEFRVFTEMLIDNEYLRRKIGINAKEYVLKHYSIKDNAHLWAEAYAKI